MRAYRLGSFAAPALYGAVAVVFCGMVWASAAQATTYSLTELGPPAGGVDSNATSINNSGKAAGSSYFSSNFHADLWNGTVPSDISAVGGTYPTFNYATGINDAGEVVGNGTTSGGDIHATYVNTSTKIDLGTLTGGTFSHASGINASGQIAGWSGYSGGGFDAQATFWPTPSSTPIGLDTLGGTDSSAYAINGSGVVVGDSALSGGYFSDHHATLWDTTASTITPMDLGTLGGSSSHAYAINGALVAGASDTASGDTNAVLWNMTMSTMMDLGNLGGGFAEANGINSAGLVVGDSAFSTTSFDEHAFLWDGTSMIDLNDVLDPTGDGWTLVWAWAINDSGQIVGYGYLNSDPYTYLGFLLTPNAVTAATPLPATLPLFASGLGGLGLLNWRRRKKRTKGAA